MKVAKETNEYNAIMKILNATPKGPQGAGNFYVNISKPTASSLHKAGFHDWMRIEKYTFQPPYQPDFKKRVEAYVQGYIMYFEQHDNLTGSEDRTLFFDWNDKKFDLVIYMKPLYVRNYDNYAEKASGPFPASPSTVDPPKLPKAPPPYGT